MKKLFGFANKTAAGADFTYFNEKRVEIPKLTIEKWKHLIAKIETLPSIIMSIFAARSSSDLSVYVIAALDAGLDEIVDLVSVLTDIPSEWIMKNVGLNELLDFIEKTARKNDFGEAGKKFRAVLGKFIPETARRAFPWTNGSSNAPSASE